MKHPIKARWVALFGLLLLLGVGIESTQAVPTAVKWFRLPYNTAILWYPSKVLDFAGSGSPQSGVTAPVGSTYRRSDGGVYTALYVKTSGTGNTGWSSVQTDAVVADTASNIGTFTATWGANATATLVGSDTRGVITLSTNVADTSSANPTFTFTFTAPFAAAPIVILTDASAAAASVQGTPALWSIKAVSATAVTVQYNGTPTATTAKNYAVNYETIL